MDKRALAALSVVERAVARNQRADSDRLIAALRMETAPPTVERLTADLRTNARLTVNFHPDRCRADGPSVAQGLLKTGRYRPQVETGLSSGGRSAVAGGGRTLWEQRLFGAAYDDPDVTRPAYGALDLTHDLHGGSSRFGSSFLVLHPSTLDRATFCVGDSHNDPTDVGTMDALTSILAGLFEQGTTGAGLDRGLTVADLLTLIETGAAEPTPARCLDGYVEAQIHGGISLAEDVDAVVVDPSFRDSEVETNLAGAAEDFGFALRWHNGSELSAKYFPDNFRGRQMPGLAGKVARPDGAVDAASIGTAGMQIPFTPPTPAGDAPDHPLQQLKYLWHCLLTFGHDAERA